MKKILWVGDSTETNSGYANYSRNILKLLSQTGKYQINELACFGDFRDIANSKSPWQIYSNMPTNPKEELEYEQHPQNKFGAYKLNDLLIKIKPDVVIDIRDWWMLNYEDLSPLRPYFKWLIMPPIDSIPQPPEFLSTYKRADGLLSYTDWGKEELEMVNLKVLGVASPAINYEIFCPLNKVKCREALGFKDKDIVLLSVMRNQKRKQFPELLQAFSSLLDNNNIPETARRRLKLHLHCQYPDNGWDLPKYLMADGIINKISFSYKCNSCQSFYVDFFKDGRSYCKKCGSFSSYNAGSSTGIKEQELSILYNCADYYIQYSSCEGFGIPILEAAACGLKTFGVGYSATKEVIEKCGGVVINPRSLYYDSGAEMLKSLPDNEDFVNKFSLELINHHLLPYNRFKISEQAKKSYSFENAAKIWEKTIDDIGYGNWNTSPQIIEKQEINFYCDPREFVRNCIIYIASRPELCDTYWEKDMVQSIILGVTTKEKSIYGSDMSIISEDIKRKIYTRQDFYNFCEDLRADKIKWEQKRQ